MDTWMRVAGAQIRNVVGDLEGNARQVTDAMEWAEGEGADVLVLPELVLTGYPPADLVRHSAFVQEAEDILGNLAARSGRTTSVVSTVDRVPPRRTWDTRQRDVAIAAKLLSGGQVRGTYHKCLLPTYGIYDEGNNFAPGRDPGALWRVGDVVVGVAICEDMWSDDGPPEAQSSAGARILFIPNASPYHRGRGENRVRFAGQVARRNGVPLVYLNFFGGQDSLVFDGGSLVVDGDGALLHRSPDFIEDRFCIDVPLAAPRPATGRVTTVHTRPLPERSPAPRTPLPDHPDELTTVWHALVTGTRDFAVKNGFPGAVVGLSGGVDSALTAAVAAAALEPEKVLGLAMPGEGEGDAATRDAEALATNLEIDFDVVSLTGVEAALADAMEVRLDGSTSRTTKRGLEAWARAAVLSGMADEEGLLVLSTSNKSELSIGVPPPGDLAGDFAPLRDCPKTLIYDLGSRLNQHQEMIPWDVLAKRTTAQETEPGGLPAYEILDPIVERYLEHDAGMEALVADGFDPADVEWVLRRIDDAEFLRRQAPLGPRITAAAFLHDRRMPISNAWRPRFNGPSA